MKSYFAKLASRATLANTPAHSAVNTTKVPDPFEGTNETTETPLSPASQAVAPPGNIHPVSEISQARATDPLDQPPTLLPRAVPTISSAESAEAKGEMRGFSAVKETPVAGAEPPSAEVSPPSALQPPIPPPVAAPSSSTMSRADETDNSLFAETERAQAQIADLQREQSILLRKADVFMERLLGRHAQSTTDAEAGSSSKSPTDAKPEIEPDQPPRLQPIPAAPGISEPDSAQPSVVIGTLTVEIVPPAPTPVAPRPQVVVVRENRGSRYGLPSSRRFGLGQF